MQKINLTAQRRQQRRYPSGLNFSPQRNLFRRGQKEKSANESRHAYKFDLAFCRSGIRLCSRCIVAEEKRVRCGVQKTRHHRKTVEKIPYYHVIIVYCFRSDEF